MRLPFVAAGSANDVQFYADGRKNTAPLLQALHENLCGEAPQRRLLQPPVQKSVQCLQKPGKEVMKTKQQDRERGFYGKNI